MFMVGDCQCNLPAHSHLHMTNHLPQATITLKKPHPPSSTSFWPPCTPIHTTHYSRACSQIDATSFWPAPRLLHCDAPNLVMRCKPPGPS